MKKNKRKNNHYKTITSTVLLTLVLTMTACSNNENNLNQDKPTAINESTPEEQLPEESGIMEPATPGTIETPPPATEEPTARPTLAPDDSIMQGEGIYVGQMDSNSIEITTLSGNSLPLRHTLELKAMIEAIPTGVMVNFAYIEKIIDAEANVKQLWLTSIQEVS